MTNVINVITLEELVQKLRKIKDQGFIETHRAHDTGIGKTLEDLLGIKENNLKIPDVGEYELKTKRLDSSSMLTIATKSPEPKGVNKILFNNYKYKDKLGEFNLHSTVVGSRLNPQGFRINLQEDKLILENKNRVIAYWPISVFDVIVSKSSKILLVFAETKGERKTLSEQFHFVEAYLLSGLNLEKFKNAIRSDKLKVDIRLGVYRSGASKGKYHDHGTGFRINKKDFLEIFDTYKKLI